MISMNSHKWSVDGIIEFSNENDEVRISIASSDGRPLRSQDILDAVVDMLMEYGYEVKLNVTKIEESKLDS